MPFSANDSIDILIRARAEGADAIKGMDSATKGLDASTKAILGTLAQFNATNAGLGKSIDALNSKIEALGKKTSQTTKQAKSDLEEFAKSLNSVISNPLSSINSPLALAGRGISQLTQALGPVGIIAAGTAVGVGVLTVGIGDLVLKASESETALRNFALRLDLPVQAARQLSIEAKLAGVSANTLEASIRTLSAGLDDPSGSGKRQAAVLRDLGIATRELDGSDRNLGEAFLEAYQKLSQMTDATKRAHDGTVLLGRGFKELIPALELHSQLAGKAKELNDRYAGVNAEFVKSQVVFTEIGIEVDALEKQILLKLIPTLEKAAGLIARLIPDAKPKDATSVLLKTPGNTRASVSDQIQSSFTADINKNLYDKTAATFGAQGLVAANVGLAQSASAIDNKYLTGLEKLEAQLKAVKADAAELNKGGIVAFQDLGKYNAGKQEQASLEAQIKAMKEGERYAKELANAKVEGAKRAEIAEGAELGVFQKLEAERKAALSLIDTKFHGNAQLKAATNREFDAKETSEFSKEDARLLNDAAQSQIAALQHRFDIQGKLIELDGTEKKSKADVLATLERQLELAAKIRDIELNDPALKDKAQGRYNTALLDASANATVQNRQIDNRDARNKTEADRKLREIQNAGDNKSFDQAANFQSRLLEVQSRPGDEVATANQIAQIEFDLEQKRFQAELQRAQQEQDINKQNEAALKLRLSDEEHIIKIKDEAILRQAEAQRKALEETEAAAGKLFDAFTSGGVGKLLQTELHSIEKSLFTNAAGLAFTKTGGQGFGFDRIFPGQRGDDGKLTDFGRLLQGTPFGDKGLKQDANSAPINATALNTQRTADILAQMAAGGAGVPGSAGLPGVSSIPGFSFLGGGASGTGASPNPFWFLGDGGSTGGGTTGGNLSFPFLGSGASSGAGINSPSSFAGILSSAKGLGGALVGGAVQPQNIWSVLSGNSNASTAGQIGTGIGAAGVVFGGVEGAIKGFGKGGVGGISSGIASIAGSAAALDPEPISKAVLSGVALVSSIVGEVFGNNQAKRASSISNYIAGSLHTLPNSQGPISQAFDVSGSSLVYGSNGGVRATGSAQPPVNINVSTMDSNSFNDNAHLIAGALNVAMLNNHPVTDTIAQRFAS